MSPAYKVFWSQVAQEDLASVFHFIAADHPETALRIFHSIRSKASQLEKNPRRGRRPPEIAHLKGLPFRELVLPPWRLVYRVEGKRVEVLAFLDSRRDLEEILYDRLSKPLRIHPAI